MQKTILEILQVLELEYGKDRKYEDDGGYVAIVEKKEDFKEIKNKAYVDYDTVIAEHVDMKKSIIINIKRGTLL